MRKNREIKIIFILLAVFFLAFLALPMIMVLARSFTADGTAGITFSDYVEVLTEKGFRRRVCSDQRNRSGG